MFETTATWLLRDLPRLTLPRNALACLAIALKVSQSLEGMVNLALRVLPISCLAQAVPFCRHGELPFFPAQTRPFFSIFTRIGFCIP